LPPRREPATPPMAFFSNSAALLAALLPLVAVRAQENGTARCVLVADGNPVLDNKSPCGLVSDWNRADVLAAVDDELYGVRCCDDAGGGASACVGTCDLVDYAEATARCEQDGMRLCAVEEVLAGQVASSGCFLDRAYVWTSNETDACPEPPRCVDVVSVGAAACPSALAADANSAATIPTAVDVSLAGVACCHDDGTVCVGGAGQEDACAVATFDSAMHACDAIGARLCENFEVLLTTTSTALTYCDPRNSSSPEIPPGQFVWTATASECAEFTTCQTVVDAVPLQDGARECAGYLPDDLGTPDTMRLSGASGFAAAVCCGAESGNVTAVCNFDCEVVSYTEALGRCLDAGLRLCTEQELLDNDGDVDCNYDEIYAWTSDVGICNAEATFGGALEIPPFTEAPSSTPTAAPSRSAKPSPMPTPAPTETPSSSPTVEPTPVKTYAPSFAPTLDPTRNLTEDASNKAFFNAPFAKKLTTTTSFVLVGLVGGVLLAACCLVNTLAVRHEGPHAAKDDDDTRSRPRSGLRSGDISVAGSAINFDAYSSSHVSVSSSSHQGALPSVADDDSEDAVGAVRPMAATTASTYGDEYDVDEVTEDDDDADDDEDDTPSSYERRRRPDDEDVYVVAAGEETSAFANYENTVTRLYSQATSILASGSYYTDGPSPTSPLSGIPSERSFAVEEKDDSAATTT